MVNVVGIGIGSLLGDISWKVIVLIEIVSVWDYVNVVGFVYWFDSVCVVNDLVDLFD